MLTVQQVREKVAQFYLSHPTGQRAADAFAAWWLSVRHELAASDAVRFAPGGNHDFGIDGFFLERRRDSAPTLHIIQAKFSESREQVRQALKGFSRSLRVLAPILEKRESGEVAENPLLARMRSALDDAEISDEGVRRDLRMAFEVLHLNADPGEALENALKGQIERLREESAVRLPNNIVNIWFRYPPRDLSDVPITVIPAQVQEIRFQGTELELEQEHVQLLSGFTHLADLVRLYQQNGEQLFARNVRSFLYRTAEKGPPKHITHTLRDITIPRNGKYRVLPERFALLHNGITLFAKWASSDGSALRLREPSVLNGCQTIKSAFLFKTSSTSRERIDGPRWDAIRVPVRVLVTTDLALVADVTVSNNRQTAIRPSAFRANDPIQLQLAERFAEREIYYERQEASFQNLLRSNPRQVEDEYRNSPDAALSMEELAQALAIVGDRPALSTASKVSELFEDPLYEQVFAPQKLTRLDLLVFLRNLLVVGKLVTRDLRARSQRLETLPIGRFQYLVVKVLARYIVMHQPSLIEEYGTTVIGRAGPQHPLRQRLGTLCSPQHTRLQTEIPTHWWNANDGWESALDGDRADALLRRLRLHEVDVFAS